MNSMPAQRARPRNIRFIPNPTFLCSAGLRLIPEIYESQCAGRSRACEDLFRMRDSERAQREAFQLVLATPVASNINHPGPHARKHVRATVGLTTCRVCALLPADGKS